MNIDVIYEDDEIVVIDKPAGVVCNRAETVKTETLQDWWESKFKVESLSSTKDKSEEEQYFRERSGLVHRLDKETSGVMVMAKTVNAFEELLRQFRDREVQKEYLALTHGLWSPTQGEISLPLGRMRQNRKMMGVREDGRESSTEYEVSESFDKWSFPKELKVNDRGYAGFSLVRFRPKTGRMHQIRVHSRHVGHPLVGDELYAGRKRSREDKKWVSGIMLMAKTLELSHPVTKKRMKWECTRDLMADVRPYLTNVG